MRRHRVVFTVVILLCATTLGYGAATSSIDAAMTTYERQADLPADERASVVPASGAVTVVTGQGMKSEPTALVAFGPDGKVIYYNDSFGATSTWTRAVPGG